MILEEVVFKFDLVFIIFIECIEVCRLVYFKGLWMFYDLCEE